MKYRIYAKYTESVPDRYQVQAKFRKEIHQIVPHRPTNQLMPKIQNLCQICSQYFQQYCQKVVLDKSRTVHVSGYKKIHNVHSTIDLIKWLLFNISRWVTSQPKFSLAAPPSLEWPPSTKLLSTRKVGRIYSNFWYKARPLPSLLNTENLLLQRRECYIREIFRANLASVLRFLGQKLKVTPRGNTLLNKEINFAGKNMKN